MRATLAALVSVIAVAATVSARATVGTVLFFGKNLQHSLIVGHRLSDDYKYLPSIRQIHSDNENKDNYIISIHRVPQLYLPIHDVLKDSLYRVNNPKITTKTSVIDKI